MSAYGSLLAKGAREVREFQERSTAGRLVSPSWLAALAERMERASLLAEASAVEAEIEAIAHALTDSGPMSSDLSPSFIQALDALQRKKKRGSNAARR